MRLARPVLAGAILTASDVAPAPCAQAANPATRYDRTAGAARAVRDLAAGEVIETLPGFVLPVIGPGQRLYVRSQAGPVVVEREVTALQPADGGDSLFVRAADGAVFAATLEASQ